MNIFKHRDRESFREDLLEIAYNSLIAAIGAGNEESVICLKPDCADSKEQTFRKLETVKVVSNAVTLRVTEGGETLADVLAEIAICECE